MSQASGAYIYTGPWINWSHGLILGSTITLSQRSGGLLTAFLALFVSAAGLACWRIISYALHQSRAGEEYQDGVHHQQQATFRNTATPGGAAWELIQLMWYWKWHAAKPVMRTVPIIAVALLNLTAFGLAGIFSSEVTKAAGNETLVRSPYCGVLNSTSGNSSSQQSQDTFGNLILNDTFAAATYAKACYRDTINSLQCNQYTRPNLAWKTNHNASCPFSTDLCLYGAAAAYEMDSGLIDSHEDLGVNAPRSHRVQYRQVTTCSPIHTENHYINSTDTNKNHDLIYGDPLSQFMYGKIEGTLPNNYTFEYNRHGGALIDGYSLSTIMAYAGYGGNLWTPIAALNRTDADVSMYFVSANRVHYEEIVTDPLYGATIPYSLPHANYYTSDSAVTVPACTDQFQFCTPNTGECTELTGMIAFGEDDQLDQLDLNSYQSATASHIVALLPSLMVWASVQSRGVGALQASETLHGNSIQIGLPSNQWMKEVSTWYGVSMALLQRKVVEFATGPSYVPEGYTLAGPLDEYEEKLCKNQKIRTSNGTTSFSVLGVAVILIVGTFLIVTHLVLDLIMQFFRQTFGWKEYKSLQWTLDGKFQMQRLAYEEAGQSQWTGGASAVPVTIEHDKMGVPKNVDTNHPRLNQSGTGSVAYVSEVPEREGLMPPKGFTFETVPV